MHGEIVELWGFKYMYQCSGASLDVFMVGRRLRTGSQCFGICDSRQAAELEFKEIPYFGTYSFIKEKSFPGTNMRTPLGGSPLSES